MVNIGGPAGPSFAAWAHRHLGVENLYRVARSVSLQCFSWCCSFSVNRAKPATRRRLLSRQWRGISAWSWATTDWFYRCWESPCCCASSRSGIPSPYPGGSGLAFCCWSSPGISRFMWFLVLFTGYWIVFRGSSTSSSRLHSPLHQPQRRRRNHSRDRRTGRDLPHPYT